MMSHRIIKQHWAFTKEEWSVSNLFTISFAILPSHSKCNLGTLTMNLRIVTLYSLIRPPMILIKLGLLLSNRIRSPIKVISN